MASWVGGFNNTNPGEEQRASHPLNKENERTDDSHWWSMDRLRVELIRNEWFMRPRSSRPGVRPVAIKMEQSSSPRPSGSKIVERDRRSVSINVIVDTFSRFLMLIQIINIGNGCVSRICADMAMRMLEYPATYRRYAQLLLSRANKYWHFLRSLSRAYKYHSSPVHSRHYRAYSVHITDALIILADCMQQNCRYYGVVLLRCAIWDSIYIFAILRWSCMAIMWVLQGYVNYM